VYSLKTESSYKHRLDDAYDLMRYKERLYMSSANEYDQAEGSAKVEAEVRMEDASEALEEARQEYYRLRQHYKAELRGA